MTLSSNSPDTEIESDHKKTHYLNSNFCLDIYETDIVYDSNQVWRQYRK